MKTLASTANKHELLQRLRRLRPDSTRRWGRMSAHQMVCHLNDSLLVATGQKAVSHAAAQPMPMRRRLHAPLGDHAFGPCRG